MSNIGPRYDRGTNCSTVTQITNMDKPLSAILHGSLDISKELQQITPSGGTP
jgi:hypothetical protein